MTSGHRPDPSDLTIPAAERRARLLAVKLAALVNDHAAADALTPGTFHLGAALIAGDTAWVLLDTADRRLVDDGRGLGPALVWAKRNGAASVSVVADEPLTVAARRAAEFNLPIDVFHTDDRALLPVAAAPVVPPPEPKQEHLELVPEIEATGATPLIEHGVVTGEVRGLEVCRVVDVDSTDGPVVRLEVGVGAHDREAFAIIHGDVPTRDALAGVVTSVAEARSPGAPGHPLNRLATERLLRWRLEVEPWLADVASVTPAQPPVPRRNLKERTPCTALGRRLDGTAVVIVCSVGVDLDVIPYAADARLAHGRADTIVVVPERDLLPVSRELNATLCDPVGLLPVPDA